jgi:hypothetical protein
MKTTDILIPAQTHSIQIDKCLGKFASQAGSKQWTEAAVTWGLIVAHAEAIVKLEYAMRIVLMQESVDTEQRP